jgi:two-component system cell cycle response regulator
LYAMSVRESLLSILPVAPGEILVVDEDESARRAMIQAVAPLSMLVAQASTGEHALAVAVSKASTIDCVLLDLAGRETNPWGFLDKLREEPTTAHVAVLVLTKGLLSEAETLKLLERGVLDQLTKPVSAALLSAKVRAVCERSRTERELRNKLRFALENAAHDALTGLFNRRYLERRLKEESAQAKRYGRPFAVILVDLDHFKLVNDTYGHEDGDRVLRHVAEVAQSQLREDDVPCRYGGEEFVFLLRGTIGMEARVVANRLRTTLAGKPLALGPKHEPRHVTFSAGIAAADARNSFDCEAVVSRADAALYRAKKAGRNRVESE